MRWIFLDSDPAALACQKVGNTEADDFRPWVFGQKNHSNQIIIPEIVDYEVRRELIRSKAWDGVRRLDNLYEGKVAQLLPINSDAMRQAAKLWADARNQGHETADDRAIDGDVILAAQAIAHCSGEDDWMILTENIAHIARYVSTRARSRREVVAQWLRSPTSHMSS